MTREYIVEDHFLKSTSLLASWNTKTRFMSKLLVTFYLFFPLFFMIAETDIDLIVSFL